MDNLNNNSTLLLIDGNSILNRAYYAFTGQGGALSTSDGFPTNAIFGFLNMFFKYYDEVNPTHACVAFDLRAPTFRHLEYEGYKANRKGMPDDLAEQLPVMKDILRALGVSISECEGFEADDILGTLSLMAENADAKTVIVTGDRDSLQLASERTTLMIPVTRGGKTNTEEYDRAGFIEKYSIPPELFVDVKALMGDSSDNIPGVKGIGEKTALELVAQFGNLESIYQNLDSIAKKGVREKVSDGKEIAFLSRRLATICREAPCGLELADLIRAPVDKAGLYTILKRLEFNSYILKMKLVEANSPEDGCAGIITPADNGACANSACIIVDTVFEMETVMVELLNLGQTISAYLVFEKENLYDLSCAGIAFYSPESPPYYIDARELPSADVLRAAMRLFSSKKANIVSYDIKLTYLWALKNGFECAPFSFDTMLGGYVADSSSGKYSVANLASMYLKRHTVSIEELTGKGKQKRTLQQIPVPELSEACVSVAKAIYDLAPILKGVIHENCQEDLYYNVELPLSEALAHMEHKGIAVDRGGLVKISRELDVRISELNSEIIELAGEDFNVNSTKQLGVILYEKLGLKPIKKTKTGYSTDIGALEGLTGKHGIIEKIVEYRHHAKLKSTYADGLSELVDPGTGRIYTTLNQAVTTTGRISSTDPNLQNIPIRLELGREIRGLFIPGGSEYVLMGADYSQIELRVLAHISEDENMIEAFKDGHDIHSDTASKVFGVPPSEVTSQMRTKAKAVNFGIVYGIGDFSLAKDIGVTRKEARDYIDSYLNKYVGVKMYMHDSVASARKNMYAETIMNRRRNLPDINSKNFNVRSFNERVAMNTPIQGSAADIIKVAMVKVYRELKQRGLKSALVLQVHDELIIDAHKGEIEIVSSILKDAMENAIALSVPLVADVSYGDNWKDLKS